MFFKRLSKGGERPVQRRREICSTRGGGKAFTLDETRREKKVVDRRRMGRLQTCARSCNVEKEG